MSTATLSSRLIAWWARTRTQAKTPAPLLRASSGVLLLALLLPLLVVLFHAATGTAGSSFLSAQRLAYTLYHTALYVGGVVAVSLLIAVPAAWATTLLNFPQRRLAVWLLFLPFAYPPYLMAYIYADAAAAVGVRAPPLLLAIITTALAVYPYIYFMVRYALRQQHCHIQSAARLLGCSAWATLWRISLPLARPAAVVGITLVALETLNDVAVAEYFGIHTIGIGMYDLWLNRGDLVSAARLAGVLTLVVLALVVVEERNRDRQRQWSATCDRCFDCERAAAVRGWRAAGLWAVVALPVLAGLVLPTAYLLRLAWLAGEFSLTQLSQSGFLGSMVLAGGAGVVLFAIGMVYIADTRANRTPHPLARAVRTVYALPGTILAQGAFGIAVMVAGASGESLSLWTAGGGFLLLFWAVAARFFIIVGGGLEAGMSQISHKLDNAARLSALSAWGIFYRIHLPLLRPALLMLTVLLFLECIKELPMTLILRPFNFDTLATVVYQYASDENLIAAAPSALLLFATAAAAVSILLALEGKDTRHQP